MMIGMAFYLTYCTKKGNDVLNEARIKAKELVDELFED